MCLETELTLIALNSGGTGRVIGREGFGTGNDIADSFPIRAFPAINSPDFSFDRNEIKIRVKGNDEETSFSRYVENSISKLDERNDWLIEIYFQLNILSSSRGEVDEVGSIDVIVKGRMLKYLQSMMSCGTAGRNLTLQLDADLEALLSLHNSYSFGIENMELHPHLIEGNDEYRCFRFTPTTNYQGIEFDLQNIQEWKLTRVYLHAYLKGPDCPFKSVAPDLQRLEENNFLGKSIDADMKIMVKGGAFIPCHRFVLTTESPVIHRELTGHFIEARTGELRMLDKTEREVLTFLFFLYERHRADKIGLDPSLALTLLEMAHYYDVKWLEEKMREYLVKVSIERYSVDDALRIVSFMDAVNDPGLKQKGVDSLALRADEEIMKSKLFIKLYPNPQARELALSLLKRI